MASSRVDEAQGAAAVMYLRVSSREQGRVARLLKSEVGSQARVRPTRCSNTRNGERSGSFMALTGK